MWAEEVTHKQVPGHHKEDSLDNDSEFRSSKVSQRKVVNSWALWKGDQAWNRKLDTVPRRRAMRFEVPSGTFHGCSHLTLTEAQRGKSPV